MSKPAVVFCLVWITTMVVSAFIKLVLDADTKDAMIPFIFGVLATVPIMGYWLDNGAKKQ